MNKALLVIDMQRGLCSGEEEAFEVERLIECVNMLIGRARLWCLCSMRNRVGRWRGAARRGSWMDGWR
jgi:hypothetical protein